MAADEKTMETQQEVESRYDGLRKVVDDAARIKTDINSNYRESMKQTKADFAAFMLDNVAEEFRDTAERLGLFNSFADVDDRKKREKKMDSSLRSFFGRMFNKTKDFERTKKGGEPKDTTPPKCDTYVLDAIASLYASRLIPEVQRALSNAGIEIRFSKPVTKLDLEGSEDDRSTVRDFFVRGANIQREIDEKNAEIEDVLFDSVPEEMKYDKSANPKGIKKSQFAALAELQAKTDDMSTKGEADKASDVVERQCDTHFANSKNQEMLGIVTELILARAHSGAVPNPEAAEAEALGGTEVPVEADPQEASPQRPSIDLSDLVPDDMD